MATERRSEKRGPKGQFAKGNQAAENFGRPSNKTKRALHDLLDAARDPDKPTSKSRVELAWGNIDAALGERDDAGRMTKAAMDATKDVLDRRYGKAKQTTEVQVSGQAAIQAAESALAERVAADAADVNSKRKTP